MSSNSDRRWMMCDKSNLNTLLCLYHELRIFKLVKIIPFHFRNLRHSRSIYCTGQCVTTDILNTRGSGVKGQLQNNILPAGQDSMSYSDMSA